jgi:hypothetical protein
MAWWDDAIPQGDAAAADIRRLVDGRSSERARA